MMLSTAAGPSGRLCKMTFISASVLMSEMNSLLSKSPYFFSPTECVVCSWSSSLGLNQGFQRAAFVPPCLPFKRWVSLCAKSDTKIVQGLVQMLVIICCTTCKENKYLHLHECSWSLHITASSDLPWWIITWLIALWGKTKLWLYTGQGGPSSYRQMMRMDHKES